jgi:hypothetical protein
VVEVIVTDEFRAWYEALSDRDTAAVFHVVSLLEHRGVQLGFPYSSAIRTSRHGLRELRAASGRRALRVLYAFDVRRQAVLLLGGDKSGSKHFYATAVPVAEQLWETYVSDMQKEKP